MAECSSELNALREAIVRDVTKVAPMIAAELMWALFTLAENIFERTSEEATEVSDIFDLACADLITIANRAGTPPAAFAAKVRAAEASSGYGEFQELIQIITSADVGAPTFLAEVKAHMRGS